MKETDKIYVAGHRGLVGSAVCRKLKERGFHRIVTATSSEIDLRDYEQVKWFFSSHRPDYVFMAAARVGGIAANSAKPVDFLMDNLAMESNVIRCAHEEGVKKLLFYGSACAYPKYAAVPVKESALLSGELEPSNQSYALAKIAGIQMCDSYRAQHGCHFISCMPTNLYGIGDHYDLNTSHVIPGMIHRMSDAMKRGDRHVTLWGTGAPVREFLCSDSLASASLYLMEHYDEPGPINISSGKPVELAELAGIIADALDFRGHILWDFSMPDGTPDRTMDISRLTALGWKDTIPLRTGIELACKDFLKK